MHYDGIFVNPLFDSYEQNHEGPDEGLSVQHTSTLSPGTHTHTEIYYAGSGFHELAGVGSDKGPTPLVNISKNFIQNDVGVITAIEDTISLEGYIMATGVATGGGPQALLIAASGMEKHLAAYTNAKLEIKCGVSTGPATTLLYKLDSARPTELVLNQNTNAWNQYVTYNVTFVGIQSGTLTGSWSYPVKNTVDTWNIEPVQETCLFEKIKMTAATKATTSSPNPVDKDVIEYNFPRFKVTHRVAANGLRGSGTDLPIADGNKVYWSALENAQLWVSGRLSATNNYTNVSGVGWGGNNEPDNTYANRKYNFTRAVNYDLTTALYEVVDTWISMPSGSLFHEDYTIEVSTNDKYVKTVRVNGTIQGLGASNNILVTGDKLIDGGKIDMEELGGYSGIGSGTAWAPGTGSTTDWFAVTMEGNKFDNARQAWHGPPSSPLAPAPAGGNSGGIKNLLYWRASSALNVSSNYGSYTEQFNPSTYNRFIAVNNPINSKETVLWPIPISTSETFDPKNGTISYSYEFNNKLQAITGAISENVSINDTGPTDVFAEVFVLGRRLGPVLQNLGAKTSSKRDISIELTVMPPTGFNGYFMTQTGCPMYTGGSIYGLVEKMVSGLMPFGPRDGGVFVGGTRSRLAQGQVYTTRDDQSWNPAEGRYTRNVSWIYQQCTTSRRWDDI